jgi:hypothetical protein
MKKLTKIVFNRLKKLKDVGIEGISTSEFIALLNVEDFIRAAKKNTDNLNLYNSVILIKRIQGDMDKNFIDSIVRSLNELVQRDKIVVAGETMNIFVRY